MLYIDVDAMAKLAHWKILPELIDLLPYSWDQITTVSSLRFRALKSTESPDKKLFHSAEAAQLVVTCMDKMAQPATTPDAELLELFVPVRGIDTGEAVLLSLVTGSESSRFLTGDKRAVRALASMDISNRFEGRIIMIDQVLWRCLEKKGRDWMLERICPFRDFDNSIKVIFGHNCNNVDNQINAALISYINEMSGLCNPSLLSNLF